MSKESSFLGKDEAVTGSAISLPFSSVKRCSYTQQELDEVHPAIWTWTALCPDLQRG